MKLVLILLSLALSLPVHSAGVLKEVCHARTDKAGKVVKDKAGKVLQDCKKIKVHKKLKGTAVPAKK